MFSHLFSFSGRSGRLEFFIHSILDLLFIAVSVISISLMDRYFEIKTNEMAILGMILFIIFVGALTETCATVRRFHDIGMSGWSFFLTMIPIVNFIIGFKLLFQKGTSTSNKYGPSRSKIASN